ncbi:hypothetical protein IWW39_002590 [Coemansia spiralis]|uniref:Uncharacterized protein n=1 Tax=Coemansia spiralis TaxID=417178 RepID=A0A9W8L559_9FUNG|nr:hypothetical protein IWW39_002590 [Coemansia spiralis]
MIELTANELAFGKKLAHVDKEIRDQAVAAIRVTLARTEEFTYMEMLRHWKALFYCFWLSDKPLVQQELSWELANLILVCKGSNNASFVRAFWETMCREWFDIDKHRIDKYLLLARRVVFFTFRSMQQSGWDQQLVGLYMQMYQDFAAHPTEPKVPNSSRTHLADVYVDELVRLVAALLKDEEDPQIETAKIPVATLLEPFMRFISTTTIRHLPPKIQESVFENTVIRIAEAEELANAADSDVEMGGSSDEGVVKDNQIEHETLDKVQFLMDSIPDIKARLLTVASEEGALPLGRKRLYALYQTLCETFPDEENDVVFPGEITVKEPVGAEERKIANKHKRKKEGKRRELKERTRAKADERKSLIAASAVQLDVNALEHEATADEERSYQEDLAKIRDMDRRAGVDSMGEDAASKTASKKAKRAAKKAQSNANGGDSSLDALADIPELVAIDSPATTAATDKGSNGCQGDEGGAWVVCNKDGSIAPKRKSVGEALPAEQFNESFVVQDKPKAPEGAKLSNGKRKTEGASSSLQGKQTAKDTVQSSDKKRLTWALERNSVKRFLKKVPMLPSPTQVSSTPDSDLKPALRKVSAYVDESPVAQSPLKPLKVKPERRVSVNGHASTPLRGAKKQKQRR